MTTYNDLQDLHQQLLERREKGEDRLALRQAVRDYIETARRAARDIARPRDRDQLRANLRFWATFLYDETGTYPDTSLDPANQTPPPQQPISATKRLAEIVDLPGPLDPPRWVVGLGVTIIILLSLLLIFTIPQNSAPGVIADATQERLMAVQSTQAVAVATLVSQPTQTPVDWEQIAELLPPPETAAPIPTIPPADTPDPTQTVAVLLTQIAQTPPTTGSATVIPTDPTAGEDADAYLRPILLANVTNTANAAGCRAAVIETRFDLTLDALPDELLSATLQSITAEKFTIAITPLNTETARQLPRLGVGPQNAASTSPGGVSANAVYIVQVENTGVTASDVIVQFDETCSQNPVITYRWREYASNMQKEPLQTDQLTLTWNVLQWGPIPQINANEPAQWQATLALNATGGDGQYLFWLYKEGFETMTDNVLTLTANACQPASAIVSVTSGGLSVVREIVLLSPFCPGQSDAAPQVTVCTPQIEVLENAICRAGPGTIYDIVTAYKVGQALTPEGRNADATWLWVLMLDGQRHCWVSASLLSAPCDADALPIVAAPPTPTGAPTLTPTPTATRTPTATLQPSLPKISSVSASSDEFYYQADTCSPASLTLQLTATDIYGVSGVTVSDRLRDFFTFKSTAWSSLPLTNTSGDTWSITIYPENAIADYADYISATFEYYFVATNAQNATLTSATYNDVTLFRCE
jgi:hypothetical protein